MGTEELKGLLSNLEKKIPVRNEPVNFGKEKPAFGNKAAKRAFEGSSTRAAVKGPTGVTRGRVHVQAYETIAEKAGKTFSEVVDDAYDTVTDKPTGMYDEGFTKGQEGKFVSRHDEGLRRGMKKENTKYISSEQIAQEEQRMGRDDPSEARRRTRAGGSADPADHERRRNRAKRTHGYLEKMKEEERLLRNKRPNPRKSPESLRKLELDAKTAIPGASRGFREAVRSRLNLINRRKQVLKALGRKAGLLGVVASPYTTGEALVGLGSKDENTRLRSVEVLNGLPDFSTGRGMTVKEKKETPVWHDHTTGEWKI